MKNNKSTLLFLTIFLSFFIGLLKSPSYVQATTIGPIQLGVETTPQQDWEIDGNGWAPNGEGGNVMWTGEWGNCNWGGARFTLPNDIPVGATINSATAEFYSQGNDFNTYFRVFVTDSADAGAAAGNSDKPTLSGGNTLIHPNNINSGVRWPAAGNFTASDWPASGNWATSPDLSTLIQTLVDNYSGLANGAHIVVWMVSPSCSSTHEEGWLGSSAYTGVGTNYSAKLTIDYTDAVVDPVDRQFSVSTWVKPSTSIASKALVAKSEELRVFTDASGYVGCQVKNSTWATAVQSSINALTVGAWSHVVCTYDKALMTIYVNGVQVAQSALTSQVNNSASTLKLGQDDSSSTPYSNFSGIIDEFKFYNYALTADEVKLENNRSTGLVLGALGSNTNYEKNATSQEYCIPGDTSTCLPPVGEWKLDENTGSSAYDSSGNGFTGTWEGTGGRRWVSGKRGAAANFNGVDDRISTGDLSSALNLTSVNPQSFTVEGWFKKSDTSGGNLGGVGVMGIYTARLFYHPSNGFAFQLRSSETIAGYYPVTLNAWHHAVGVYDSTNNRIKLYIDGQLVDSQTPISHDLSGYTMGVSIGNAQNFYSGLIDDVKVYGYERTPAQIAWDYNKGAPIAWWKIDECQGTALNDSMRTILSGGTVIPGGAPNTSVGTCNSGVTTEMWNDGTTGKFNGSLGFDGVDDYATIADNSSLDLQLRQMSVSYWFNSTAQADWSFILSKMKADSTDGSYGFYLDNSSPNRKVAFSMRSDANNGTIISNSGITDGRWYHVVGTWDGLNVKMYIDGVLQTDTTTTSGSTNIKDTAFPLVFGASSDLLAYFNGLIDDVRIYSYPLTLQQVKTVMNQGSAVRFGPATGSP